MSPRRAAVPCDQRQGRAHVRLGCVRPDVALAPKHAWATDPSGEVLDPDPAMVAIYVMVKHEQRWWIAARANTIVAR